MNTYTEKEIKEIMKKHQLWIDNKRNGVQADLRGCDMSNRDWSDVNFQSAFLQGADFSGSILNRANFCNADLRESNFTKVSGKKVFFDRAELTDAIFKEADLWDSSFNYASLERVSFDQAVLYSASFHYALLQEVDMKRAFLTNADFSNAMMNKANLTSANCSDTNFKNAKAPEAIFVSAKLNRAKFSDAILCNSVFTQANLEEVQFANANLSGVSGIPDSIEIMDQLFEKTEKGYIVYKSFGLYYAPREEWVIEENSVITEVVNPDRGTNCGSGIHVATKEWVETRVPPQDEIWKCLIEYPWLLNVVIPYETTGKIRTGKLRLLEKIG